ncbi:MAG: MazG nucleotide pyrophosphohydrolase domain-containing protein [Candidatus Aenigmatarchaeota archaeon]
MKEGQKKQFIKLADKIQERIFQNKKKKGFNTDDVPFEFGLTSEELSEAFEAWRKGKNDLPEELADTVIYLFGLASILDIDLGKAIVEKMEKNENREYEEISNTFHKK